MRILELLIALLVIILGASPALLGVISGVVVTLKRPLAWQYDIDYTPIEINDSLYFDIETLGGGNRVRSFAARRKYVKPRPIACGATQVCQI